jgi:hypothetical protein
MVRFSMTRLLEEKVSVACARDGIRQATLGIRALARGIKKQGGGPDKEGVMLFKL